MLWCTAAKQAGKLYRGIVKAAGGFTARRNTTDMENSWLRHGKRGHQEEGREGERAWVGGGSRTDTVYMISAVDEESGK